ncbi:hypothetical protein D5R40_32395, partial [Okeania hirsuta]
KPSVCTSTTTLEIPTYNPGIQLTIIQLAAHKHCELWEEFKAIKADRVTCQKQYIATRRPNSVCFLIMFAIGGLAINHKQDSYARLTYMKDIHEKARLFLFHFSLKWCGKIVGPVLDDDRAPRHFCSVCLDK